MPSLVNTHHPPSLLPQPTLPHPPQTSHINLCSSHTDTPPHHRLQNGKHEIYPGCQGRSQTSETSLVREEIQNISQLRDKMDKNSGGNQRQRKGKNLSRILFFPNLAFQKQKKSFRKSARNIILSQRISRSIEAKIKGATLKKCNLPSKSEAEVQ